MKQAFWDETFGRLGLGSLQGSYGKAVPVR